METTDHIGEGSRPHQPGLLVDRFSLDISERLLLFDSPAGHAYEARDSDDPSRPLYAIVHSFGMPHRASVFDSLIFDPIANLINPIAQLVMNIKIEKSVRQRQVTFFEKPLGGPVLSSIKSDKLTENFIKGELTKSLIQTIATLHARGLTHRAIRPQNLFFADAEGSEIILGECVSASPGSGQHHIFEPLETAYADTIGRGDGTPDADNFALGVTLLSLLRKKIPSDSRSLDDMYSVRVNQGSYQALIQGTEFAVSTAALLRGLISDDPGERWSLKEVSLWVEHHAPRKRAAMAKFSLSRPINFMGTNYSDRRTLAHALAKNIAEAAELIRKQEFSVWIQQILAGEAITERTERLILSPESLDGSKVRRDADALVARFCALLDPTGPLRFRGLTICYDGIPTALAAAYISGESDMLEAFRKLLCTNLIKYLIDIVGDRNDRARELRIMFSLLADEISSPRPGKGLERFLYNAIPALPCLSPHFKTLWIDGFKPLLEHLDKAVGADAKLENPLDLHFCAFAASKIKGLGFALADLPSAKFPRGPMALSLLEALGLAQRRYSVTALPNISAALAEGIKPLIAQLHYLPRREKLQKTLQSSAKMGDLRKLVMDLDLKRNQILDACAYSQAIALFSQLEKKECGFHVPPNRPIKMFSIKDTGPRHFLAGWF